MTMRPSLMRILRGDPNADPALRRGEHGLDWFSFFCANLQTGFGPFVSVYLTTSKWTQTDIGLVLMIGGLVGLFGQIPGGALVDRTRSKALVAGLSVAAIGFAALCVAVSAFFPVILFAWVLHAAASCVLSPSIATISLGLVGYNRIGHRLGRNATFASVGSALAAAGMGAVGYYISNQAVFFVTALLAAPAIAALGLIRRSAGAPPDVRPDIDAVPNGAAKPKAGGDWKGIAKNRPLLILALATALFYLSNAAMLPLVGSVLTMRSVHSPTILIAACIIVPQIMVAILSPMVGTKGQSWGRRPLLLIGFAALPIRGLCLGLVQDPTMFVVVQLLDGISASVLGVIVPLIAADTTRHNGGFAMAQGVIGTAMGLGASFSSTMAGALTDHYGSRFAFFGLTGIAFVALVVAAIFMPETRDGTGPRQRDDALASVAV
ncbi:MFS transporter [Beijerinckia sp. L45]|uniref:MFS transporter n=1 Tax=Beijerinckia sp. L45 TaxID=1641855 RepID=UPI001FEF4548|nr:MFS transporter [Beijerinckia sp. L45]